MFPMLDVAIGLAFTYLLLSLLCTAINEWVATWGRLRAKVLVKAIARLASPHGVENEEAAKLILNQPEVLALSPKLDRPPSYIPKAVFVRAATRAKLAEKRSETEWGELFDATMDRATGWYKRRMQVVSLLVAVGLTVLANADTVRITDRLWRSPVLRAQFVEVARQRASGASQPVVEARYPSPDEPAVADSEADATSAEDEGLESDTPTSDQERELLAGVMGWRAEYPAFNARVCERYEAERDAVCAAVGQERSCEALIKKIAADPRCRIDGVSLAPTDAWPGGAFWSTKLVGVVLDRWFGWLLTVAAISVGAPFWFDTLSRFVNIRGTGRPPAASVPTSPAPAANAGTGGS